MQSYLVGILHIALLAGIGLVISAAYAQVTLDARDDFVYRSKDNAIADSYLINVLENDIAPEGTTIIHVTAIEGTDLGTNVTETFLSDDYNVEIINGTRLRYDIPHGQYLFRDYKITFNYTIMHETNSDTATVTVTNVESEAPNAPPELGTIQNFEINELSEETRSINATDETRPNGDLVWTTSPNSPEGINITSTGPTMAELGWTPTEQQGPKSHTFNITVSDGEFTDTQELTITVNETNQDPIITDPGSQIAHVDEQFRLPLDVGDGDWPAQSLSYAFIKMDNSRSATDDTGAQIDSNGVITWTPTVDDIENHTVTVIVTDDFDTQVSGAKKGSDQIDIVIEVQSRNPSFDKDIGNAKFTREHELFSYAPGIIDRDTPEGPFTIQITGGQTGNAAINSTNHFVWTPGEEHGGNNRRFELTVTDPDNRTGTAMFFVNVIETNQIPIITDPGPQTAYVGHEFELDVNVTDNDDIDATPGEDYYPLFGFNYESMILQTVDGPTGARINDETGLITWTPTADHKPSQTWTVEYDDDFTSLHDFQSSLYAKEASGTDQIVINVDVVESPAFGTMKAQMIEEEQTLRYTLPLLYEPGTRFADLNIAIAESDRRGNAAITKNETHADFVWTPGEGDGGNTHMFALNVTDTEGSSGNTTLSVTVVETNQNPVFDDIDTSLTHSVNTMFNLDLNATDNDLPEQMISYEILSHDGLSGTAPTINGTTGEIAWNLTEIGQHALKVRASDDYNPPGRNDTTVTIRATFDDMENPVITLREADQNPQIIELGDEYGELGADATDDDPAYDEAVAADTSDLDLDNAGNYTVTYHAPADDSGKKPENVTRAVRVQDTMPPAIMLNGTSLHTIGIGEPYEDRGATADDNDPDYVGVVTAMPATVDTATAANHTITYTANADDAGNMPEPKTRIVEVKDLSELNQNPDAPDETHNVTEGGSVTITPGISDPDMSGTLEIIDVTMPSKGDITESTNTTITYTPRDDEVGDDSFDYTVQDNRGGTDTGIITINIIGINDPPVLTTIPDMPTINELDLYEFDLNATDPDPGDGPSTLTYGHTGAPEDLDITGNRLSWTPTEAQGPETHTFNITVSDDEGATDSRQVTITVEEVNTAPVLDPLLDEYAAPPGMELVIDVNANDTDIPVQALRYEISSARPTGMEINSTDGRITWMPTVEQAGINYTITVMVDDGQGSSDTTTFMVIVQGATGPNQNPIAPDILINAELHFPSAVTPAVTDPDGDDITITHVTEPALGILDTSMLPQISYTPNQTGIDRLNYTATDSKMGTDTGTITIFINPEGNARPVLDHIYNIGGRVGVDLEFTATAEDSDDTSLAFDIANAPDGASITAGGDFSWRPVSSQNGTHTVTFIVHDDSGGADWQHVLVTILRADETNLPPVPQDIDAGVVLGGGRGFQPDIVDPEGDMTEITRVYDSSLGDVDRSFTSQGIIVYVAGVLGDDEVIYTVSDGRGGFANGTISITVEEPANVRPLIEFVGDKSVNAGDELTFTVDAEDLDGFVIDFGLEGATQGPSMSPLGVFSWTPTANDVGRHEFTILVFDDAGDNSTVSITVTVRPEGYRNSPPVAPDVVIMTPQDVLSIIRPTLTDPDEGDPVRISQTGDTTKGNILSGFLRAGIIIYLPNQGETGTETITYTVSDSSDDTDTATINVFISARGNTDPILGSIDFRNINAGDPLAFDLEAEDPDGDTVSYQPVGAPDGIEISPEGAFNWTPTAADVGNHTFTVIAYDDRGGADSKTAVIRVLPAGTANQAPNAPSSTVTVAPGGSIVITPVISDPDGDKVAITNAVADGTGVVIPSEDSINYIHIATTPTETITYTVTDARGATSTNTITVTIITTPN